MEFTLHYQGKINSGDNKKKDTKHTLRRHFHKQLKELQKLPPLKDHPDWFTTATYPIELRPKLHHKGFDFMCLVSHKLNMYVDLKIQLFTQYKSPSFKDIDNKLKIIFDSLQIPDKGEHLPSNWRPDKDESPLICLLSDDRLIYKLQVDTDYILDKEVYKDKRNITGEIICLIKVKIKGNKFNPRFNDLMV